MRLNSARRLPSPVSRHPSLVQGPKSLTTISSSSFAKRKSSIPNPNTKLFSKKNSSVDSELTNSCLPNVPRPLSASKLGKDNVCLSLSRMALDVNKKKEDFLSKKNIGLAQKDTTIRIQILSNWGHPETVSCSEIDILGQNRIPVAIKKILVEPPNHASVSLAKLHNGDMIKGAKEDLWLARWPPKAPLTSISLIFKMKHCEADSIRIWPTPLNLEMNMKSIVIFVDDERVYQGDLPNNFGKVIPLNKVEMEEEEKEMMLEFKRNLNDRKFKRDSLGFIYPNKPIQDIEVKCFESYESVDFFGLARIRIFDQNGAPIDVRTNAAIIEKNCGNDCAPAAVLFHEDDSYQYSSRNDATETKSKSKAKGKTKTSYMKKEKIRIKHFEIWKGELNKPSSDIQIHFTEPTLVSAMILFTFRHPKEMSLADISAKKVRVYSENKEVWAGRLRHSLLPENDEKAKENDCATIVYFMDDMEVQKRVFENAFPSIKRFVYDQSKI